LSEPGFAFASSISSRTECTGSAGWTTRTFGESVMMEMGEKSRIGSKGALRNSGPSHSVGPMMSRVWPSGCARATISPKTVAPPVERGSTTTDCPSGPDMPCATIREVNSAVLPGAPVTIRSGRDG
jgi:hypothetical protein